MGFSFLVASVLLFPCFSLTGTVPVGEIQTPEFALEQKASVTKFTEFHILEGGSEFDESIDIDEKKEIEHFKVPSHNGLSESDYLYDFKMNITVRRVKKDGFCYITPLPPALPRPNELSKKLNPLSGSSATHKIEKTIQQWRVGARVNQSALRQAVRDFCGQFPIYRLEPFTADSISVMAEDHQYTRTDRKRRDISNWPLCNRPFPTNCHPNTWLFTCKIRSKSCVYYVTCEINVHKNVLQCRDLNKHLCNTSILCCSPKCP
ncbi:uncharacterized protein LOC116307611 [Actinia tenebrosa]|uniref:Uncharacterized protein LOC116307611 n=1 Tax=Actinia tenebrosa TaxID=6105 RepID=A0A6P8J2F1_ACTTE|nr:uncharacterized protein LOC116307611 [Actinia tenebrosa]